MSAGAERETATREVLSAIAEVAIQAAHQKPSDTRAAAVMLAELRATLAYLEAPAVQQTCTANACRRSLGRTTTR